MLSSVYYLEKCRDLGRGVCKNKFLLSRFKDPEVYRRWRQTQWEKLFSHAQRHSPFYAKTLGPLTAQTPFHEIPVLTKQQMLEHFDQFLTTPQLKFSDVNNHLNHLQHDAYFQHRFKIFRSGGSSGNTGVMVYTAQEFSMVLAQILRSSHGVVCPPKGRRLRGANLYATTPTHDSIRISQSFQVGFHVVQDFSAACPAEKLIEPLIDFNPDVLSGYPSKIFELAFFKLQGLLRIQPRAIFLGSEPLTPRMRAVITRAFGIAPFDHYGTTEAIVMATECHLHRGLHLEDDLHIIEIFNKDHQPAQPGELGHKIYVTNLAAFTQPIIRYELSDLMLLHADFNAPCPCGHPGRLVQRIVGRSEDIFRFQTPSGPQGLLTPQDFQDALDPFDEIQLFQVINHSEKLLLKIQIGDLSPDYSSSLLRQRLERALHALFEKHNLKPVPFVIEPVKHFERHDHASQKFRQVWNLCSKK